MIGMEIRSTNKLVHGVGINDATYNVYLYEQTDGRQIIVWRCPYYARWCHMLQRCYSDNWHERHPTYIGCSVCEEWLIFSNFKRWMEQQDWEGNQLDKDLLVKGNKEYNPDNCVFVTRMVNSFLTDRDNARGEYLIGVHFNKSTNKFQAQCRNPFYREKRVSGSIRRPYPSSFSLEEAETRISLSISGFRTCD